MLIVCSEKKKLEFYCNLNTKILIKNKTFQKTVKPFLADKTKKLSRIILIEDENIISEDNEITESFNDYFINIPTQKMPINQEFESLDSSKKILF